MKKEILNNAWNRGFIKSLPVLKQLDLTANEINLIELVLHYQKQGLRFFMNHRSIANYLVLNRSKKNYTKVVGNIIRSLKNKGYLIKEQSSNFNGTNGGSSCIIKVDEVFLEGRLQEGWKKIDAQSDESFNEPDSDDNRSLDLSLSPIEFCNQAKLKYGKSLGIPDTEFNLLSIALQKALKRMDEREFDDNEKKLINTFITYKCPNERKQKFLKLV